MSKEKSSLFDKFVTLILLIVILFLAYLVATNIMESGKNKGESNKKGGQVASKNNEIAVVVQNLKKEDFVEVTLVGAEITNTLDSYNLTSELGGKITKLLVSKDQRINEGDIIAYVDPSVPGAEYKEQMVKSSLSGVLSSVNVYVGQNITSSTPIAQIGSVGELEITAKLPERLLSTVKVGMDATFKTQAWPDEAFKAKIKSISETVNPSNRTFTITLSIDKDERLKSGMYVSLSLVTDIKEDVIMLPSTAVKLYLDEKCVFVNEDGKAVRKMVTTGKGSEGRVIITSGLEEDEKVIVKGTVTEGTLLRVVE